MIETYIIVIAAKSIVNFKNSLLLIFKNKGIRPNKVEKPEKIVIKKAYIVLFIFKYMLFTI